MKVCIEYTTAIERDFAFRVIAALDEACTPAQARHIPEIGIRFSGEATNRRVRVSLQVTQTPDSTAPGATIDHEYPYRTNTPPVTLIRPLLPKIGEHFATAPAQAQTRESCAAAAAAAFPFEVPATAARR